MAARPRLDASPLAALVVRVCPLLLCVWGLFLGAPALYAAPPGPTAPEAEADPFPAPEATADVPDAPPEPEDDADSAAVPSADAPPAPEGQGDPSAQDEASATPVAEAAPARELLPGRAGACGLSDAADPLVPVAEALDSLLPAGFQFGPCRITADALRGRSLEINIQGSSQELLLYILERMAVDGYEVQLAPRDADSFDLVSRPTPGVRGVQYVRVRKVELVADGIPDEDRDKVSRIAGLDALNFHPSIVSARLQEIGYRSIFVPVAPGQLEIRLQAARALRRVRVYGQRGLPEREILRSLSIEARPGALARGRCVSAKSLRKPETAPDPITGQPRVKPRPPICDADDFACRQWEANEIRRLERHLFEQGYFHGKASLALACGKDDEDNEADLHVYIERGPAYRVDRNRVAITGAPSPEDQQWIRRQFIPRTLWFFRTPMTRAKMDEGREDVERYYAEPERSLAQLWRRSDITYPEIQVSSSYDELDPTALPDDPNLPLEVRVDAGQGIRARFRGTSTPLGVPGAITTRPSFSRTQLTSQLQIFTRRDSPNRSTAPREAANVRAFYQRKGYLFAEVDGSLRIDDDDGVGILDFTIFEGPKVRIRGLELPRTGGIADAQYNKIIRAYRDEAKLRKRGYFDERSALEDLQTLLAAYTEAGYLCAGAHVELAFWPDAFSQPGKSAQLGLAELVDARNKPAWVSQLSPAGLESLMSRGTADLYVRLVITPGPQVTTSSNEEVRYLENPVGDSRRIDGIPITEQGQWGATRILRDTPLRRRGRSQAGFVPLNLDLEDASRSAIVRRYRDDGYPVADAELTWRYRKKDGRTLEAQNLRELVDPQTGFCSEHAAQSTVRVDTVVSVYEGKRGRHGELLLRGNFKTKDRVLEQEVDFKKRGQYRQREIESTLEGIEAVGVARGVRATPYPVGCDVGDEGECVVHQVVTMEESRDIFMDVPYGFGLATLNPLYLFANPSFPNMNGSAWNLDLEGRLGLFGIEGIPNARSCDQLDCYEHNVRGSVTRPHIFGSDVDFEFSSRYQQRVTPARGRIDSAYANIRGSWRFAEGMTLYGGYLFQLANVSDDLVKPLGGGTGRWVNRGAAIVSDRAGVLETGIVINRVDNPFNPSKGFIAAADFKLASPFLGGQDWFARADLSWQHFIPIPLTQERVDFRYSLRYGHAVPFSGPLANTKTVPDIWRYYGGGTAALGLRGILPETMLLDVEEIQLPYGGVLYRPRAIGGQIRAIGTLAIQVVSVKDFIGGALAHSVFYDFGVLTQFWAQTRFPRDYRHSAGLNVIKWDIQLVTLALGYAWLLPTKDNIGPTDDRNGRVVFDVGVTF